MKHGPWNPWRTVPRDGTPVLVLFNDLTVMDCAYETMPITGYKLWNNAAGDQTRFNEAKDRREWDDKPIGWLPFPGAGARWFTKMSAEIMDAVG